MFRKSSYVLLTHALRVVLNKSFGINKCLHGMNGNSVAYTMQTFLCFFRSEFQPANHKQMKKWIQVLILYLKNVKPLEFTICRNPSTYSDVQFQSILKLFLGFSRQKYEYVPLPDPNVRLKILLQISFEVQYCAIAQCEIQSSIVVEILLR